MTKTVLVLYRNLKWFEEHAYKDDGNDYWENKSAYLDYKRFTHQAKDNNYKTYANKCVIDDEIGEILDVTESMYELNKWAIICEVSKELTPEVYI